MRRTGRIRGFIRWAATIAFLLTSAIWVLSYFRTITFCEYVSSAPPTLLGGRPVILDFYKLHRLDAGAFMLGIPMYAYAGLMPVWDFGNGFAIGRPMLPANTYLPAFVVPLGIFVIPVWIPWLLFGLPAFLLWRREFWRRRWHDKRYYKVVRERTGKMVARMIAIPAYGAALVATIAISEFVVRTVDEALYPKDLMEVLRQSLRVSETALLSFLLFFWFFISFLVTRVIYRWARWKTCYDDVPRCVQCYYELTGNTTGRCPECGTEIPKGAVPSE